MVTPATQSPVKQMGKFHCFGEAPLVLNASDLALAKTFGLLRPDVPLNETDSENPNYGLIQDDKRNIDFDFHESQKAIQRRCKQFALKRGFQLYLKHSGTANAKYCCKKLNGQQFCDPRAAFVDLQGPFFINTSGSAGRWQISKANFCHNHLKHVGFTGRPLAEGSLGRPEKAMRNTTQQMEFIIALIEHKMLPAHDDSTCMMTGKPIATFLKSEGITLSATGISRIKCSIDDKRRRGRLQNYQKLESYLSVVAAKI